MCLVVTADVCIYVHTHRQVYIVCISCQVPGFGDSSAVYANPGIQKRAIICLKSQQQEFSQCF